MVTYLLKLYVIEIVQLFPNPLILSPTLKFEEFFNPFKLEVGSYAGIHMDICMYMHIYVTIYIQILYIIFRIYIERYIERVFNKK